MTKSASIRVAENDDPTRGSDGPPGGGKRESRALITREIKSAIVRLQIRRALRVSAFALLRVSAELAANVIPVVGEIADAIAVTDIVSTISELAGLRIDAKTALDFIEQGPHTLAELQVPSSAKYEEFSSYQEF